MLEHITETIGDFKYLSVNCDTIYTAFNESTLDGNRIGDIELVTSATDNNTVYVDVLSMISTKEGIQPYNGVGIDDGEDICIQISDKVIPSKINSQFLYYCDNCYAHGSYVKKQAFCTHCGKKISGSVILCRSSTYINESLPLGSKNLSLGTV
jgi:hypothetical protein